MKFVALVSGGKDSCFNIVHCLNAGHELVAMANLHPKPTRPEEIDSWMFQTVGHKTVEYIAQCAEVPLFKAEISEDEEAVVTELADLFRQIKESGIEFEGISVGAIASTYQQVRVDKACSMVGLRSLSYLWQRPQSELLHEIVQSGLDARIIKVAGMGLNKQHLGKSLAQIEDELISMHEDFGLHPCGEGGEYETMVFDAPFFKKHKLAIKSETTVHHSTDDVYYLEFEVAVEPRSACETAKVEIPPLLDTQFAHLLESADVPPLKHLTPEFSGQQPPELGPNHAIFSVSGDFKDAFPQIGRKLEEVNIAHCYHVEVVLKTLTRFTEMNEIYNSVFKNSARTLGDIPPSRACIEAPISEDVEVTVFYSQNLDRSGKGIHVQGLSYWAPASIGPYSQCRMVDGISYVAGQIGLIPQSLDVASEHRETEALLALQNAFRILDVVHESRSNWEPILALVFVTSEENAQLALQIWKKVFNLPLMAAVVGALPRNARFEWLIQACDIRYFSWFIPESDEDEEFYSAKPEILYNSTTKYIKRAGFQLRQASTEPLSGATIVLQTSGNESAHDNCHLIPAKSLFYNGLGTAQLHIAS